VGATTCGDRETLVEEARRRIAQKPGAYFDRIYGLQEVGGTSVLYLSAVPFEQIGLRTTVPLEPLPALTWRVLGLVPDVVSTGSVLLGGIWWMTNRRAEVAKAEGKRK
jgi:formate dehydrogenase iron-sulfur subunit